MLFCIIIVSGTFSAVVGQEINLELSVIERTAFQSSLTKSYRHNTNSKPIVRVTSEHKYYHLPGCMDPILFLVKYKPFIQYT